MKEGAVFKLKVKNLPEKRVLQRKHTGQTIITRQLVYNLLVGTSHRIMRSSARLFPLFTSCFLVSQIPHKIRVFKFLLVPCCTLDKFFISGINPCKNTKNKPKSVYRNLPGICN